MTSSRVLGVMTALVVTVGLWLVPSLAFPNPGVNDAIILSDLTLPVAGAILTASIAVLMVGQQRRWSATAPVALGTFLVGVALVFVIALLSVGNLSNDRFGPLLFLPAPFLVAGVVVLTIGLGNRAAGTVRAGLAIGGAASILLLAWILARGSRDWLVAPYGFDILLLISLEATVVYAGAATLVARGESPAGPPDDH